MTRPHFSKLTPGEPPRPGDDGRRYRDRLSFLERLERAAEAVETLRLSIIDLYHWVDRSPVFYVPLGLLLVLGPYGLLYLGDAIGGPLGFAATALGCAFGCITLIIMLVIWKE